MNYHAVTRLAPVAILALVLGACGGSGSGPNPYADDSDNTSPGGADGPGSGDTGGDETGGDEEGSDEPVSLTITSPATGGEMETPDAAVTLAGTADSDADIVSVSWSSDKGEQGEASGEESWKADAIPLEVGENTITITARDSTGATATERVVIKRESGATGSVTLNWEAPTTRMDGSALTDLAGYRIRYGRMSKTYDYEIEIDSPGLVSYVVEGLKPGKWYFALTAYDSSGLESDLSNEVTRVMP